MWLVLGIGFLIKGPVSIVVFIFTLSSYVLWNKDINLLKNIRPFWGIICFMIIVFPWVFIIQKTTDGLFFQKAISEDFLPKLLSEQESHGGYPGYYFLISSLMGFNWKRICNYCLGLINYPIGLLTKLFYNSVFYFKDFRTNFLVNAVAITRVSVFQCILVTYV